MNRFERTVVGIMFASLLLASLVTSEAVAWQQNAYETGYYVAGEPRPPQEYDAVAEMRYRYEYWHPNTFISQAQQALAAGGFYRGPIDGYQSPAYRAALWNFQKSKGLLRTAELDRPTVAALVAPALAYGAYGPSNFASAPAK